ncbi:hypothetical protein TIFTF001_020373 [Ficus carica]|uniref:Uncharacterized protein n=1 Tax=Ficus carica TaxID=3494 RepID=A0AA88ADJ6_FICCA|nr:hypothetical protein TIFTF001_020373 [Ficus carica]
MRLLKKERGERKNRERERAVVRESEGASKDVGGKRKNVNGDGDGDGELCTETENVNKRL